MLTFSSMLTSTDIFANSADPDEIAHATVSSGYTLFAISLLTFDRNPHLQQWMCPNSEMEKSIQKFRGERVNRYPSQGMVNVLKFWTSKFLTKCHMQTVQTQIRLLLKEQSDQGLQGLPLH